MRACALVHMFVFGLCMSVRMPICARLYFCVCVFVYLSFRACVCIPFSVSICVLLRCHGISPPLSSFLSHCICIYMYIYIYIVVVFFLCSFALSSFLHLFRSSNLYLFVFLVVFVFLSRLLSLSIPLLSSLFLSL